MTGLLTDFIFSGLAAARPASPDIPAGTVAYYLATDTKMFSAYLKDSDAWANLPSPSVAPTDIPGTTHTLGLADENGYLRLSNVAGCTVTIPENSTAAFAIGTVVTLRAANAGTNTLAAAGAVVLNKVGGSGGSLNMAEEGAVAQVKKIDTDEWDIIGGMAAS